VRTAFFAALAEAAAADPDLVLLTGDLGFAAIEPFRKALPDRYFNVGVSEQAMIGTAAGLAMNEHRVFVYSIAPFVTLRVYEFLRNDVCYPRLPVVIVGVGGGYAYDSQGFTHHGTEDLALMRSLPGMTIVAPADPPEVRAAVKALARIDGPAYLRLGRAGEPALPGNASTFALGRARVLREGHDATIFGCGSILGAALEAAAQLKAAGVSTRVVDMATIKPIDRGAIRDACQTTRALVSVEEHALVGGLGSAVADVLAELPVHPPLKKLGFDERLIDVAGDRNHLLASQGLSVKGIAGATRELLDSVGK
jgi:transketolase